MMEVLTGFHSGVVSFRQLKLQIEPRRTEKSLYTCLLLTVPVSLLLAFLYFMYLCI